MGTFPAVETLYAKKMKCIHAHTRAHTHTHTQCVKIVVMINSSENVGRKRTNHEGPFLDFSLQDTRINFIILSVCLCVT